MANATRVCFPPPASDTAENYQHEASYQESRKDTIGEATEDLEVGVIERGTGMLRVCQSR